MQTVPASSTLCVITHMGKLLAVPARITEFKNIRFSKNPKSGAKLNLLRPKDINNKHLT